MTGCASTSTPTPATDAGQSEVTVYAASSLQRSFTELGRQFEAANPGMSVRFNFGGSSDLVAQLQQGAPADVFASADTANMDKAVTDQLTVGTPRPFATNSMEIAVPPGNPAGITSFASLATPDVTVVVCAEQVPCGAATREIERRTGVTLTPVSEENAVADVLGKVTSGQVDAGVVYTTDVAGAAGSVAGVTIPREVNAENTYPIAVLAGSANPTMAQRFLNFVLGSQGREVLAAAGFGVP